MRIDDRVRTSMELYDRAGELISRPGPAGEPGGRACSPRASARPMPSTLGDPASSTWTGTNT